MGGCAGLPGVPRVGCGSPPVCSTGQTKPRHRVVQARLPHEQKYTDNCELIVIIHQWLYNTYRTVACICRGLCFEPVIIPVEGCIVR
jgi:hypothetical protein